MSVDSDRQWFVYYKETEMGPFPEPEMVKKIRGGDFDATAFVYTDGMSDWELIKDTPLQNLVDGASPKATTVAAASPQDSPAEPQTEKLGVSAFDTPENTKVTRAAVKEPRASAFGFKSIVAIIFLLMVLAGYYFNRDLINSYFGAGSKQKIIDLSKAAPTSSATGTTPTEMSVNWAELDAFVKIQDPQGPAFRLSDTALAGMRPILIGALSPMLKMTRVTIAVFPDNDRSLYAVPPVWIWNVGVHGGYFSAGPHLNNGQDLFPGRYRVLIASQGKFLGDVGFDLGVYPIGETLTKQKTDVRTQITEVSSKERAAYKTRAQTFLAIEKKALALEPLALDRKNQRSAWLDARTSVIKELGDLREQQSKVMSGPMFYAVEQNLLLTGVKQAEILLEGLEYFSFGGVEHVKLKLKATVPELKASLAATHARLETAMSEIEAKNTFEPLRLDGEIIKAQILEESKQ